MRTLLVTGSDTAIGKTQVVASLARLLAARGARVQIVKVVETGRKIGEQGDAERAQELSACGAEAVTLLSFSAALAPAAAARKEHAEITLGKLLEKVAGLPPCDWRIFEGAGGIASPLDEQGNDWADFGSALSVEGTVIVVANRIGAINQARLAYSRAGERGLRAGIWLNAIGLVDDEVAASNREGLSAAGVPLWAELASAALVPKRAEGLMAIVAQSEERELRGLAAVADGGANVNPAKRGAPLDRYRTALDERTTKGLRRSLRVTEITPQTLNLADNDYLDLTRSPAIAAAVSAAVGRQGSSASASPLITGWRSAHADLVERLGAWHGFPFGLLWSSGYAANSAVLSVLPGKGDLVLADRLVHHSMIAGLLQSGARLQRYEHLNLVQLETHLSKARTAMRGVFVVTESVFSMDGDYPDLKRMAELKRQYGFVWIVDEAHALGWYGPEGAGLVRLAGVEDEVDVMVGTFGKTLASGGAYTLFQKKEIGDYLVNTAGEFIYSTALSPLNIAAAAAALDEVCRLSVQQGEWQATSRKFRARLREAGWNVPPGDSPIVPVTLGDPTAALSVASRLRQADILVGAVRPPTVPDGTSRLRISLKRTFNESDADRVLAHLAEWRRTQ